MAEKGKAGRPPKYKSKEEIEEKIENYFKECAGEILKNSAGEPIIDKKGKPILINEKPPTITGLALALGFASRQALLNYQEKKEFNDTITRAKSRVEEYAETRLFDKEGSAGAQFSLRNNFDGWYDKPPSELDRIEQQARIDKIKADTDRLKNPEQEEDGVTIINDAPKTD